MFHELDKSRPSRLSFKEFQNGIIKHVTNSFVTFKIFFQNFFMPHKIVSEKKAQQNPSFPVNES